MKVKCLLALVVVVGCIADNFAAKVEEEKSKEKGLASKKKRDTETDITNNQQVQHEVQDPKGKYLCTCWELDIILIT